MNYQTCKYRHWTQGAVECYKRGCVCKGCETFELIGNQCRMKAAVIELVKNVGPPPDNFKEKDEYSRREINSLELTASETNVRDLLLQGLNYKQVAEKLSISLATVKTHVAKIFEKKNYHSLQDLLVGENKRQDKEIIEHVITKNQEDPKPKNNERIEKDMIKINTKKKFFDADLNYSYGQSYIKIIDAIKKGYTTNNDIASVIGINGNLLSVKYRDFCRTLEDKNLLNGLEGKTYLQKIVSFVNKRMSKIEEKPYIPAPGDIVTEQINVPVKRKTDADYIKELTDENERLRERLSELESQPKPYIDFDEIRHKIQTKIDMLQAKLNALELLERELTNDNIHL